MAFKEACAAPPFMAETSVPADAALNPYTSRAVVSSSNLPPSACLPSVLQALSPSVRINAAAIANVRIAFFIIINLLFDFFVLLL